MGLGCKVFCKNNGWLLNGKHGQGTHSTKMGTDKLFENPQMPQNAWWFTYQNLTFCKSQKKMKQRISDS